MTYLLVFTDFTNKKSSYLRFLLSGIITALIINFHISFGIGVFLGVCLFFLIDFVLKILKNKANWKRISFNYLTTILFFALGIVIAFLPFFLFESRHGFNQTKTAINAFTKYGAVVHLKGLNKQEIFYSFFSRTGDLLHIQGFWIYLVEILAVGWLIFLWKTSRIQFKKNEKRLVAVLVAVSIGVLFIYLAARNPVWSYHFIATEIIFLLLIALVISKVITFRYLLTAWILFIVVSSVISFTKSFNNNPYASSSLLTKEYIVDIIAHDAGSKFYTVFYYSPSIYQYDYTYLFRWRQKKDVPYDPGSIPTDNQLTYIILPTVNEGTKQSYINFRTPNLKYQTIRTWNIPDGTTILKRERK